MSMGVQERRELEKQMRRSQILDAARKLLFLNGIENISIAGIAKEAELGVGTIYFHYKNKEEIFIALQQEGLSVLFGIIRQVAEQEIPCDEKLRQIADAYYAFSQSQPEYYSIINYFLSSPKIFFTPDQKQEVDTAGSRILEIIRETLHTGIEQAVINIEQPDRFSVMFWGTLHGLTQFKKFEQTILNHEDHKSIYDYSVEQLINQLKPQ